MAKNVEIIIKADDQASASLKKISDSAKGTDEEFKRIKESGERAKASTEAFAQVLSIIGQGELASLAGAFTGIADKMRDIRGEAEGWQAQTVATKGLIAVGVFSAAVAVGKQIGDWVFQTERANKALERMKALAEYLNDKITARRNERIGEEVDAIEEMADAEERRLAAKQLQSQIDRDIAGTSQRIEALTREIEQRESGIAGWAKSWSGEYKEITEQKKQELALAEQLREVYRDHNQTLLEMISAEQAVTQEKEKQRNIQQEILDSVDKLQGVVDRRNEQEARDRQREQDRIEREKDARQRQIQSIDDAIRRRSQTSPGANQAQESRLLSRVTTDDKTVERDQLAELRAQKELLKLQLRELERQARQAKDKLEVDIVG